MSTLIYGIHPVREALLSSKVTIQRILISKKPASPALEGLIKLAQEKGIRLDFVEKEVLDQKVRRGPHQNVLAIVEEISYVPLEEILQRPKQEGTQALLLILDGIQDPQNLGSLIRTGLGCGAHGVILPRDRAAGITPAVVKASAGATAHLPVARVVNIAATIDRLKEEGLWVYGASGDAEEVIYDLDFNLDLAIVIGGEGKGIRPLVKKKCDRLFSIPMKGPVSSFNASVSGGMALYEAMRQRHFRQKGGPSR